LDEKITIIDETEDNDYIPASVDIDDMVRGYRERRRMTGDAGRMTHDAGRVTGDGCWGNEKAPGTSAEGLSVWGFAEAKPLQTNAIVPDGYPVVNR